MEGGEHAEFELHLVARVRGEGREAVVDPFGDFDLVVLGVC